MGSPRLPLPIKRPDLHARARPRAYSLDALKISRASAAMTLVLSVMACSSSTSDDYRKGMDELGKGELSSGVIHLKNAVQKDPKSMDTRLGLAEALERSGDLPGAEEQLRRALALGGDADQLTVRIAVLLLDRGDSAVLLRDFAATKLSAEEANSDLKALLALAYLGSGQTRQAAAQLEGIKQKTPAISLARAQIALTERRREAALAELAPLDQAKSVPWWVSRGASRVYQANGDAPKALEAIKKAYDAAPQHRGVMGEYAEQLIGANRRDEARKILASLRKAAPTYYRTQYLEALFLMEDGKPDLAYQAATKVLAALPQHTPSQLIAARIELERNEFASVEARAMRIVSADPNSVEGLRLLANLEMRRGNVKAASAHAAKALSRAPDDRNLLALAASLAWQKGDRQAALTQLKAAALQEPQQIEPLARLAELLQASGNAAEAQTMLEKAIQLAKNAGERQAVFNAAIALKSYEQADKLARREIELRPKDPEPLMWLAAVLGSQKKETEALEQTRKALTLRSDFYPALMALGGTANTPALKKEHEDLLQKAVDSGSTDQRIYLERVRLLRASAADSAATGAVLEKGLKAIPGSLALTEVSLAHWRALGDRDRQLGIVKAAEEAMPNNPEMTALAANTFERLGDRTQAVARIAKLAERYPERVDWNLRHSRNLEETGKKDEAAAVLRRLIQKQPTDPVPHQALAMFLVRQEKFKEAQVTAEILRDQPATRGPGLLLLGDVQSAAGRKDEALKTYELAGKEGLAEAALQRRVVLLDKSDKKAEATAELGRWLAAHPASMPALGFAAQRASLAGDYAGAAKFLEVVVKANASNPVAINDLAWAYVMAKNPKALETARRAAELAPGNANVLDTLSQAQWLAGQKDDAVVTARKALGFDPGNPVVRLHLAEILLEGGKKTEAQELVKGVEERYIDLEGRARLTRLRANL